ncbi:MAG: hypothetical protein AAGH15_08950 [Myxococcota bacterium]
MASKLVTDRQKSAELVLAILDAQGARLERGLAGALTPEAAAQSAATLDALTTALAAARDRMVDADRRHEAELGDDPAVRKARDEAAAALRRQLIGLREVVRGVYGPVTERGLFRRPAPDDPVVLARFAGEVAAGIGALNTAAPRIEGHSVDPAAVATALEAGATRLEEALTRVAQEAREAQATQTAKKEAIAVFDRTFTATASTLAALFQLAGELALAERVRPSARRPGRIAGSDETPPAPVEAESPEAATP